MMNLSERVYSLRQAADLTGFSQGKFRYNKDKLVAAGATVSDEGWRIPHTTLQVLGWVDPSPSNVPAPSALEIAEARVRELEVEVAALREELSQPTGLFRRRRR